MIVNMSKFSSHGPFERLKSVDELIASVTKRKAAVVKIFFPDPAPVEGDPADGLARFVIVSKREQRECKADFAELQSTMIDHLHLDASQQVKK